MHFAERITGGFYLNIEPDRRSWPATAWPSVTCRTLSKRAGGERWSPRLSRAASVSGVTVRYPRELRSDPQQIAREVPVPTMGGTDGAARQLAKVRLRKVMPGIPRKTPVVGVYLVISVTDIGGYVADVRRRLPPSRSSPTGLLHATWSGQFEFMERAIEKMKIVIPITLLTIFLLLPFNFRRITETLIVMLSCPFALVGGCG